MLDGGWVRPAIDAGLQVFGSPVFAGDVDRDAEVSVSLEYRLGGMVDIIDALGQIGSTMDLVGECLPGGGIFVLLRHARH